MFDLLAASTMELGGERRSALKDRIGKRIARLSRGLTAMDAALDHGGGAQESNVFTEAPEPFKRAAPKQPTSGNLSAGENGSMPNASPSTLTSSLLRRLPARRAGRTATAGKPPPLGTVASILSPR